MALLVKLKGACETRISAAGATSHGVAQSSIRLFRVFSLRYCLNRPMPDAAN